MPLNAEQRIGLARARRELLEGMSTILVARQAQVNALQVPRGCLAMSQLLNHVLCRASLPGRLVKRLSAGWLCCKEMPHAYPCVNSLQILPSVGSSFLLISLQSTQHCWVLQGS